ncbi:hypothetical protein HMSSN139_07470 [Paenibacillus sp. HMSSN-139]|nr:hypothetical protein HMSSN139_07470 [Paenibacillus sp. HMSSN-139]
MLPNKRIFRIKGPKSRHWQGKGAEGSITLEAALITPVFVMVVFWFVFLVHMTLLSGQLHAAAANAVKQVSAHIYPVAIAVEAQTSGQQGTPAPAGETGQGSPEAAEIGGSCNRETTSGNGPVFLAYAVPVARGMGGAICRRPAGPSVDMGNGCRAQRRRAAAGA